VEGGNVREGWKKIKINKRDSTFIRKMRVNHKHHLAWRGIIEEFRSIQQLFTKTVSK
jgi:hypothetical protein